MQPTVSQWSGTVKRRFSFLGWNRVSVMLQLQKAIHELAWGKAVTLKQNSPAFTKAEAPAILRFLLNPLGNYCAHLAKASHDIPRHRAERARTPSSAAWGLFCAVSHSLLLAAAALPLSQNNPAGSRDHAGPARCRSKRERAAWMWQITTCGQKVTFSRWRWSISY